MLPHARWHPVAFRLSRATLSARQPLFLGLEGLPQNLHEGSRQAGGRRAGAEYDQFCCCRLYPLWIEQVGCHISFVRPIRKRTRVSREALNQQARASWMTLTLSLSVRFCLWRVGVQAPAGGPTSMSNLFGLSAFSQVDCTMLVTSERRFVYT